MADLTDHRLAPPLTGADVELDEELPAAQLVETAEELEDDKKKKKNASNRSGGSLG